MHGLRPSLWPTIVSQRGDYKNGIIKGYDETSSQLGKERQRRHETSIIQCFDRMAGLGAIAAGRSFLFQEFRWSEESETTTKFMVTRMKGTAGKQGIDPALISAKSLKRA